jgi:hypothetical protein
MCDRASVAESWIGVSIAVLLLTSGCETGESRTFAVVPGPTVPSPIPTAPPYAWDTRDELEIWIGNAVTRGPAAMSLVGEGRDAAIRIEPQLGQGGWVLRGPDLTPPASGIRGVRIRYRWQPDPSLSPGAVMTFTLRAVLDVTNAQFPPEQPTAFGHLQPTSDWTDGTLLVPSSYPLEVRHTYLHQYSSNPGVFELDRIELVE